MKLERPGHPRHLAFSRPVIGPAGIALSLGLLLLHAPSAVAQPAPPTLSDSSPADSAGAAASDRAALEAVNLAVQGFFTATSPRVGDSLDYVLRVEWADVGVPVVVLAPDSLDFPGFKVIGQATVHKKLVLAQGVGNRTEYTYRLRATTPGGGKASSLRLRYLSGVSRNEESVFAPAAHIDILPGRTPLKDALWFRLLAGWFALAAAGALAWSVFKVAGRKRLNKAGPSRIDLRPEVLALKGRMRSGDSKAILLDMEDICVRHLRQELGGAWEPAAGESRAAAPKFDPLLDRYLARNGATGGAVGGAGVAGMAGASDGAGDWKVLRELFRHARFAGGHKEPHELQDAYRTLKKALRITDEPGDE